MNMESMKHRIKLAESQLEKCPICKRQARIGYACGDYFVFCGDGNNDCNAPMCDHPTLQTTITEWNEWAIRFF